MIFAAGGFGSTPGTWAIIAGIGVFITLLGYLGRRVINTQDEHTKALTETTKSLALLVSDHDHTKSGLATAIGDIDDLAAAVQNLQMWRAIATAKDDPDAARIMEYGKSGGHVLP